MPPKKKKKGKPDPPLDPSGLQILDAFSEKDIRVWEEASNAIEAYRIQSFYHFEGLRNLHSDELLKALEKTKATTVSVNGWTRIINYRYSLEPLSAHGSLLNGGRFNIGSNINSGLFKPFPALYCAENYHTAYAERFGAS